jgi:hypothetical protein
LSGAGAAPTFPFVQLELAGATGIGDGRYPLRDAGAEGGAPSGVLVVAALGAPMAARGRPRRRARPRQVEPGEDPAPVPITRLTVVRAEPFADGAAGERWLARLERDPDAIDESVAAAVATVNVALHAHAIATQDPALAQVSRSLALAIRVGVGSGEEVADGRWSRAVEVPTRPERQRRVEALRPAERLAAVLGGRERPDACETLLLRARADLDAGRGREAALQLHLGLDALLAELAPDPGPDQEVDLATLGERRDRVAAIARWALDAEPDGAELDEVADALLTCERVLRRRRILGTGAGER